MDGFYFSFCTLSTIGFGDIALSGTESRSLLIWHVFLGIASITYLTSMISERANNAWMIEVKKIETRVDRYEVKAKLKARYAGVKLVDEPIQDEEGVSDTSCLLNGTSSRRIQDESTGQIPIQDESTTQVPIRGDSTRVTNQVAKPRLKIRFPNSMPSGSVVFSPFGILNKINERGDIDDDSDVVSSDEDEICCEGDAEVKRLLSRS